MTSGDSTSEMNPEWENLLAGSSLGKKMEKLSELQEEGADVMHSTFTHLKNFPFFMELSNWFLPFNMNHSVLNNASQGDNKDILSILSNAIFLCNSDKYSLFLSIMMLPENMRQMMSQQVSGDSAELVEQSHEELISKRGPVEIIASQYIQDLYRFHKLYQRRYDFLDIFSQTLDFHNLEILQPYISDRESLTIIAEFYLRKNYFRDALTVYDKLSVTYDDNQLLQKKGYCEQMLEDYDHALQTYLKAGLTDTNSLWLLRHIAVCYRMLKQPKEALDYYMRCEQFAPDNLSIQINIGNCLLSMKEYTEALKYYFKVDYLDSKNHRAWRPIAWCSFITGKYDQAQNYYKKILAEKPEAQDYLNAGHTEWALRNLHAAVSDYAEAARNCGDGYPEFEKLLLQDLPELKAAGIHENDVQLMLDSVSFSLSGTL
jgi:tetratricopeptide (TPR) repeat protein